MQINKHGSFYIRNGWPTKIIDALSIDKQIFSPNKELEAVDTIGVGRVMIKAMRYWASVSGIATEKKGQQGVFHELTPLGLFIKSYDLYCMDKGTLWLLHRNISRNIEMATAWYWAFNEFDSLTFSKSEFSSAFYSYLQSNGESYNKNTVEKEFDCFKNTYISEQEFSLAKILDENTIPFFAPLALLESKGGGVFEKRKSTAKDIPVYILLACIIMDNEEHLASNRQINIDQLLSDANQVCKYMMLNYSSLIELLQRLENERYLRLINNFGSRYIELNDIKVEDLLGYHYRVNGG